MDEKRQQLEFFTENWWTKFTNNDQVQQARGYAQALQTEVLSIQAIEEAAYENLKEELTKGPQVDAEEVY